MPTPKEAPKSSEPKLTETSVVAFDVAFVDTAVVVAMSDGDPAVNRHDVFSLPAGTTSLRSKSITLVGEGVTLEWALNYCAKQAAEEMGALPTTPRSQAERDADGLGPVLTAAQAKARKRPTKPAEATKPVAKKTAAVKKPAVKKTI